MAGNKQALLSPQTSFNIPRGLIGLSNILHLKFSLDAPGTTYHSDSSLKALGCCVLWVNRARLIVLGYLVATRYFFVVLSALATVWDEAGHVEVLSQHIGILDSLFSRIFSYRALL
jgi:hypothetical protein